jgi:uncharacterized protein YjiS (DUF1127 family)
MSSMMQCLGRHPAVSRQQRRPRQHALRRVWRRLKCWHERARQRRQLAGLSDRALRDMAVSRVDALREAEKPFWRE